MRILIATRTRNPVIPELATALSCAEGVRAVEVDSELFWSAAAGDFDVVHIHWPEALFAWRVPSAADLTELDARLRWWQEHACVVATVHNLHPHVPARRALSGAAYELVFRHASGLIHMGLASQTAVETMYPWVRQTPQAVIPHLLYSTFPNAISREQARTELGVQDGERVFLCFGGLRRLRETRMLLSGFRRARVADKRLLIAGKITGGMRLPQRLALRASIRSVKHASARLHYVAGHDVQRFFNAADVVVVPRLDSLNSGNVILGYAFGRVVVGPNHGVAGEILQATGNPVFRPDSAISLAAALEAGDLLSRADKGSANRSFAEQEWNAAGIAGQHVAFFQELMSRATDERRMMHGSQHAPGFSIVIPAHNRAHLLPRAIASVLAQTLGDFEVIVVDDGSTDDTRAVMERIGDARARYVYQANAGAAAARNHGARVATGRYITFLDSDDEAFPGWLEALQRGFVEQCADIVCCGLEKVDPETGARVKLPEDMGRMFDHAVGRFTNGGVFALRRSVFEEAGGYAEGLRSGQHTELAMRLLPLADRRGWTLHNVMEPLVRVHVHEGPRIRANPEAIYLGSSYTLRTHHELFRRDSTHHAKYHAIAGVNALRIGRVGESRRHFVSAIRSDPIRLEHWSRLFLSLAPALARRRWADASSATAEP